MIINKINKIKKYFELFKVLYYIIKLNMDGKILLFSSSIMDLFYLIQTTIGY